ncbi:MAG: hypothetical protein ACFFFH_19440, partial [Candidatus Thorarchaeota archaeon]
MTETKEIAWDLTLIFKSEEEIQETIRKAQAEAEIIDKDYRGKINSTETIPNDILRLFECMESLQEKAEGLFYYGQLKVSGDQTDEKALELQNTLKGFRLGIKKKIAFVKLELGELLVRNNKILESPILANYYHYMENILRKHKHTLSEAEEQLILEKDLNGVIAWSQFRAEWLGSKPFKGMIDNEEKTFFWSEAQGLMRSSDRTNRKNTIITVMDALKENGNIFSSALRNICANHVTMARHRNYDTMASSLITNDVSQEMIDNLFEAIEDNLDIFHDFLLLKAKILGTEKL